MKVKIFGRQGYIQVKGIHIFSIIVNNVWLWLLLLLKRQTSDPFGGGSDCVTSSPTLPSVTFITSFQVSTKKMHSAQQF